MKAKGWMAVALAVVVAGFGTGLLARFMGTEQDAGVTAFFSASEEVISAEEKELEITKEMTKKMEKEITKYWKTVEETKKSGKTEDSDYKIEMSKKQGSLKKTNADISAEKAVKLAIKKIREIFGFIDVEVVREVELTGGDEADTENDTGCRAYMGYVYCKEKTVGYQFVVDSITGVVLCIRKATNYVDPGYKDDDRYEEIKSRMKEKKAEYEKLAKEFIAGTLKEGRVVRCKLEIGGNAGTYEGFQWRRIGITAECRTVNGTEFRIWMDPDTNEITQWKMTNVRD